ncbi:MAG: prepilin-type N-terminal cleavage/methylation domain-containing protein, partial [Enterococcus italicus]
MSGFTLIEAIVSLFVMLIILAIGNQVFGYMQAVQPHLYQS